MLRFPHDLSADARVLVTGGSGFIGTNLVASYTADAIAVWNLDAQPPRNPEHEDLWIRADIREPDAYEGAFERVKPTHIVHLAARTDLSGHTVDDYAANTAGVRHLLETIKGSRSVRRVIFASSRMVCKIGYQPTHDEDYCPSTAYGASKVEAERIIRSSRIGPPWVIVRPTSIWGPWFDTPYRDFFVNVARGRYMHPRGRRILKSFGFVLNSVSQLRALTTAATVSVAGRTFYLADSPPIEVRDLANRIRSELDMKPVMSVPISVLRGLAAIGDRLQRAGRYAPLTTFRLSNLLTEMIYDLEPLESVVGSPRYDLDEAVRITIAWIQEDPARWLMRRSDRNESSNVARKGQTPPTAR
jgi:nucleoside-diphosphate-sugar epimerase